MDTRIQIAVFEIASNFAENKDIAKEIRDTIILPTIKNNKGIIIDFAKVDGTTQSFIHALINEPLREQGEAFLKMVEFKNCNNIVKNIVLAVVEYSLIRPEDL